MSAAIKRAKMEKWMEFLEEADTSSIWTIGKMVKATLKDGGNNRIPELIVKEGEQTKVVRDNEGKVEAFRQAFFPPPPETLNIPTNPIYPPPAWHFSPPTTADSARLTQKITISVLECFAKNHDNFFGIFSSVAAGFSGNTASLCFHQIFVKALFSIITQ